MSITRCSQAVKQEFDNADDFGNTLLLVSGDSELIKSCLY